MPRTDNDRSGGSFMVELTDGPYDRDGAYTNDQQQSSPTIEQIGGDKILVDFSHSQKLPVWLDEGDKMVVFDNGKQSIWNEEAQKVLAFDDRDGKELLSSLQEYPVPTQEPKRRWICGLRRRWFYAVVCSILVVSVAGLAAGLGAGLSSPRARFSPQNNATSNYDIGGSLNPAWYSTSGAFNGSGFSLADQHITGTGNEDGNMVLYFQHHDSTIRWTSLNSTGWAWEGGTISEIVASDAKNNTPISSVAFSANSTSMWHVFYIDKNNQVRERVKSNATSFWEDGALANSGVTVLDSDQVAMQVCWYGNVYGDSDYPDLPANVSAEIGLHLWYAVDNHTIQQLGWRDGDQDWTFQKNWTGVNPHAGVGCYSWGPGTTTYVMMVNQNDTLQIWAKNTNTSNSVNSTYPINEWVDVTPADSGFDKMHPSTSVSYMDILYAQTSANIVQGWNITWDYVNTSIDNSFQLEDHPGIPGTHFAATSLPDDDGGAEFVIFYQMIGNDISALSRDQSETEWFEKTVPIPSS
ncbi:hypothetical protein KCU73_g6051, partial [Aureobasidium melanogenum]